jgi:hypothetical protein
MSWSSRTATALRWVCSRYRPRRTTMPRPIRSTYLGAPRRTLTTAPVDLRAPPDRGIACSRLRRHLYRWRWHPHVVPARHPHPHGCRGGHRQGQGQRRAGARSARRRSRDRHGHRRGLCRLGDAGQASDRGGAPRGPRKIGLPAGSMGPKVDAAIEFACKSGRDAVIGALVDLPALRAGEAGTRVSLSTRGVTYR